MSFPVRADWPSPRRPDTLLCGLQFLAMVVELPLDRRDVADGRVQPDGVVAVDPRGDGRDGVGSRREPVAVDELSLERREERFGGAVVEARRHPACGLGDAEKLAVGPVGTREVVSAPVRVERRSGQAAAQLERPIDGVFDELRAHVVVTGSP